MNVRVLVVVVLAVVCGLSAVFLVQAIRKPVNAPTIDRTPVVFAVDDVKTGEMVSEKGVEVRQIPTEQVPEDAIRKISDAIDRAAKSTIDKGDMLRELKLADKGAGRGMAALIQPGMRAFTIQTPSYSSSLGGFLLPGNLVDINLTISANASGGEPPRTLLQDVKVLAVDKNVSASASNKINPEEARFVTVEVNPEDALKLQLGQNQGTLGLTLRNPSDKKTVAEKPVEVAVAPPPPPSKPEPEPKPRRMRAAGTVTIVTVRTLRGTQSGRETLKVAVPPHETLNGFVVSTPYGLYRLDDSLVLEADPKASTTEYPFPNPRTQQELAGNPPNIEPGEGSSALKLGNKLAEMGRLP